MRRTWRLLGFSMVAALLTLARPAAAQTYTITDLGDLGGGLSVGYDINASGQVVGQSLTDFGEFAAFLWLPSPAFDLPAGMHDLGTLGGTYSEALGINDSGQVVGRAFLANNTAYHAFLWQDGEMHDLGTLRGTNSQAFDINDAGQVVGWSDMAGNRQRHAFLWRDGQMIDLGDLGGGNSIAYGINASGEVVGTSSTPDFASHAFRTAANGPTDPAPSPIDPATDDLGTLGGFSSTAYRINGVGQVAGHSQTFGNITNHAFLTVAHSPIDPETDDLGTLGGARSEAWGINASGQVAGWSFISGSTARKAFFSSGLDMVDLNTLIDPALGWRLDSAFAINDAGQVVGSGISPAGGSCAFLLRPRQNVRLTLEVSVVTGCLSVIGTVTLAEPAHSGGAIVMLRKSAELTAATVPAFVTVPAGALSASFTITTTPVTAVESGTVTADFFGSGESASLTVRPISVAAFPLDRDRVKGGRSVEATITLECPVPDELGSITVALDTSNVLIAKPLGWAVVFFPGQASQTVTFISEKVKKTKRVTLSAAANGRSRSARLTVK